MVQFVENEVEPNQVWRVPRGPPRRILLAHMPDVPIYLGEPEPTEKGPPPSVMKAHTPEALQEDFEVFDPDISGVSGPTALDLLVSSGHAKQVDVPKSKKPASIGGENLLAEHPTPPAHDEGVFTAYHPSVGEKVKEWFDLHANEIPLVNFFKTIHDQVDYARKADLLEAAETGKTWKAEVEGFLTGLMVDSTVNLPGFLADSVKSIWDSTPAEHTTRTGFKIEDHKSKTITGNPDKELEDKLMLAEFAPSAYKAEERIEKANALAKQMKALNEEAERLNLEMESMKALGQKAAQNPDLVQEYNKKALELNKKAEELNQRAQLLEEEWVELNPEGAERELGEFYKRLNRATLGYSIAENLGSAVGLGLVGEGAIGFLKEAAPEDVVTKEFSFPEKYFGAEVNRVTKKTTVYKGWLNKKPIENVYDTLLKSGDDVLFQKSFRATPENVLFRMAGRDTREWFVNKLYSREELGPVESPKLRRPITPAEFEELTGRPFPVGVKKIGWPGDLGREFRAGDRVMDVFFPGADPTVEMNEPVKVFKTLITEDGKPSGALRRKFSGYRPKFSLTEKEKPLALTPEDWEILNRITQATRRTRGEKWIDFSRSGNVAQTFYDPPLQALERENLITGSAERIAPDLSNFKLSPMEAYSVEGKPLVGVPSFGLKTFNRPATVRKPGRAQLTSVGTLQLERTIQSIGQGLGQKSLTEGIEAELDVEELKRELMRKFGQKPVQESRPVERTVDIGALDLSPIEDVEEVQIQLQKVKPIEVQLEKMRVRTAKPKPPVGVPPVPKPRPPLTAKRRGRKSNWGSLEFDIEGWVKKLKDFDFGGGLAGLEKGFKI